MFSLKSSYPEPHFCQFLSLGIVWLWVSWVAWWIKKPPAMQESRRHGLNPWVRKIPWRRAWQPTPVFLPENPMGRGAWQATIHRVAKSWTWLKGLSIHACRISCNLQRVTVLLLSVQFGCLFFSCLIIVAKTSMLNKSGKSRHPCLVPGFTEKSF